MSYKIIPILVTFGIFLGFAQTLPACDVPRYRYALEAWPVDVYKITIFHNEILNSSNEKMVEELILSSTPRENNANYEVEVIDAGNHLSKEHEELVKRVSPGSYPWVSLEYPKVTGKYGIIWSNSFSEQSIRKMIQSPARREIVDRIARGESAVWVLLESGDKDLDNEIAGMIEQEISYMADILNPGVVDLTVIPEDVAGKIEIKVKFSLLRVSRRDPLEETFIQMLLKSERGLLSKEPFPIVIPIFGRGRVLYALSGKGINSDNISEGCKILVQNCAGDICEIKENNPGIDLLFEADWCSLIDVSWVGIEVPLVSLASLHELQQSAATGSYGISERTYETPKLPTRSNSGLSPLMIVMIILGCAVLIITISATILIAKRRAMIK